MSPKAPPPEPAVEERSSAAPIDLANYELVDLTYAYGDDTLYWPTSPTRFELEQLSYGMTEGGFFYAANQLCTPEHGGTHLDAPIHFAAERWTTDAVPLERLVGPAGKSEYDRCAGLGLLRLEADDKAGFHPDKAATDLKPPEITNSQRAIDQEENGRAVSRADRALVRVQCAMRLRFGDHRLPLLSGRLPSTRSSTISA